MAQSDFTCVDWVRAEKEGCSHFSKRPTKFGHLAPPRVLAIDQVIAISTAVVSVRVVMEESPKGEELGLKHQHFGPSESS